MNFAGQGLAPCAKFDGMRTPVLSLSLCLAAFIGGLGLQPARAQDAAPAVSAMSGTDAVIVQARQALRKQDKAALASLRSAASNARHPLALWVDYWELQNRLSQAQQAEFDAFAARWAGSYVEDRLRNDWLLELGRRRDWANVRAEFPRFRMNDDREVSCYALLARHLGGEAVPQLRSAAREAWWAQRDLDDGCALLAATLFEAKVLLPEDVWQAARQAMENNRPRAVRGAVGLLGKSAEEAVTSLLDKPSRFLRLHAGSTGTHAAELKLLALMRVAASDPDEAAGLLDGEPALRLPADVRATAWAHIGRQAALKLMPQAAAYAGRAWQVWDEAHKPSAVPPWSDEVLAWHVRAALRQGNGERGRWALMQRAIGAMSADEQRDGAWVYWRARARQALARPGPEGDAERALARAALESITAQPGFYGKLATEDLGGRVVLPPSPLPLSTAERSAARAAPGFTRALQLIELGLRSEGVREWNFTLRGLGERELLAAAQLACERQVWDRCINTSDRTRTEIDMAQRFPMPFREQVQAKARDAGLDAAVLFGLIRQESRFITDARSGVGASGLMQLMPATARWTAKKIGLDLRGAPVTDPDINLQLGAAYLKRVLDEFGGSLAMATAAYNAGPGRPRRWREGVAPLEPAAWAETIPFSETRDYVKKVLSNSVDYDALMGAATPTLKARLGPPIGPRGAEASDRDLP